MNSYNENLHSDVLSSLQAQELDIKKKKSQQNAAMFSLYYAQGARITAADKLELANNELAQKGKVKDQAVNNSNISTNLLAAAEQEKTYVEQSVTNAAVSAANVQVASNAILKLAADMSSVFSIVNAADFGGDIYDHAEHANDLINKTAVRAEVTSQLAMEASSDTAQVSAVAVEAKAKNTHANIENITKVISTEFDTISTAVNSDNVALASAKTKEKAASGILVDMNADYYASQEAYDSLNESLNIDLYVPSDSVKSNGYSVHFDLIKSPFDTDKSLPYYPVKEYYIMLVKSRNKSVFNVNSAERIIQGDINNRQYIKIAPPEDLEPVAAGAPTPPNIVPLKPVGKNKTISTITVPVTILDLVDTDGDIIQRGDEYVVFVMAVYYEEYKRTLNNYEDFLSAPSATFSLTYTLEGPDPKSFDVVDTVVKSETITKPTTVETQHDGTTKDVAGSLIEKKTLDIPEVDTVFTFELDEHANEQTNVEYRCMFLPSDTDITKGLITEDGLRTIEQEVKNIQKVSEEFDPKIAEAKTKLASLRDDRQAFQTKQEFLTKEYQEVSGDLKSNPNDKKLLSKQKKLWDQIQDITKKLNLIVTLPTTIQTLEGEKNAAMKDLLTQDIFQPGVFFNVDLAEQVSAANYTKAILSKMQPLTPAKSDDDSGKGKGKGGSKLQPANAGKLQWQASLGPQTTDNYGNPLIPGNSYVPVVLTFSTEPEELLAQYTNVITDYSKTSSFVFQKDLANT